VFKYIPRISRIHDYLHGRNIKKQYTRKRKQKFNLKCVSVLVNYENKSENEKMEEVFCGRRLVSG